MSKKTTEKEVEKARIERKWKHMVNVITAFQSKIQVASQGEETELFIHLHLGEGELEDVIEEKFHLLHPNNCIAKEDLSSALNNLSKAANLSKKYKDKQPHLYQDAYFLLCKCYFITGDYQTCVDIINSISVNSIEEKSRRSRYIYAEALTCKGLSLESLQSESEKEIIECYKQAGEIALAVFVEGESSSMLKRSQAVGIPSNHLTPLLETSLLKPADLMYQHGSVDEAIQHYRFVLRAIETKATYHIRKSLFRRLAEVLLSSASSITYNPPSLYMNGEAPLPHSPHISPNLETSTLLNSLKSFKKSGLEGFYEVYHVLPRMFCPRDEIEESVIVLLLSEAMLSSDAIVHQGKDFEDGKRKLSNETRAVFDLLVFALTRRDQYNLLSQCLERNMKLAFEEFHIWFQFALSLICDGKHSRALLILEQCHQLQSDNVDVMLLMAKICINNLQLYDDALGYAAKVVSVTNDQYIEANARLAIGICYSHLASKANSSNESKKLLKQAVSSLQRAQALDDKDVEILYHLSMNLALSKQLNEATSTIKEALALNAADLLSLHLMVLLLSAEKKYHEALDILDSAIEEYPNDFHLLITRVKLTKEYYGNQAALVQCHNLLTQWNEMFNTQEDSNEVDNTFDEQVKSPSFSLRNPGPLDSNKLVDATTSLKKVTLADGTSLYDEDGNTSIAASIYIERALSENTSIILSYNPNMDPLTAIALLCKLWLITAECFINVGDTTEASSCLLEAAAVFPLSPDVLYMRGRLSELQKNKAEAKACYESTLTVQPNHKTASQRLGMLHHDEGNFTLAEKILRVCLQNDFSNHTAWNDLGLVYESCERFDEAIDCFTTSLELEQTAPIVSYISLPRLFKAYDNS